MAIEVSILSEPEQQIYLGICSNSAESSSNELLPTTSVAHGFDEATMGMLSHII